MKLDGAAWAFVTPALLGGTSNMMLAEMIAQMIRGETPDPKYGAIGKQRSVHNNYLTLPVLLMMVSQHYPFLFSHPHSWLIVALIIISGWIKFQINTMKGWMGERMLRRLRYALFDYILRFPLSRFRRVKAAEMAIDFAKDIAHQGVGCAADGGPARAARGRSRS